MNKFFSINSLDDKILCYFLGIKLSFKRKQSSSDKISKNFAKKIHANIKKYKYVHIMKNDKFNKPFVDFLNANFNPNEHMVLCYRDLTYNSVIQQFPVGDNVYEFTNLEDVNLDYDNIEKIILHSIFKQAIVEYLYKRKELLKNKCYWMIFGADLYNAKRDEKNDFVRCNFKGYVGDSEAKVLEEKYGVIKEGIPAWYTFPITNTMLDLVRISKKDYIKIQINNSSDESTLEMLDILSRFKNENVKITTILSCGKMEFKEEIIKKGKEIFGDKFEYVDELLSAQEFAQHLAQNDILILNQNRQQGFGNTIASLYLGQKVFIRNNVTTYKYFADNGITVFDSFKIQEMSFEEFIDNCYSGKNRTEVKKFFDDSKLAQAWEKVFND